jgi:hypothetical protein
VLLALAVGTFCCGGFLAAWGAVAVRPQLEQLGMPIIFGGMLALVLGLLPQIFIRRIAESRIAESRGDDIRFERSRTEAEYDERAGGSRPLDAGHGRPTGRSAPHFDYARRESPRPEAFRR